MRLRSEPFVFFATGYGYGIVGTRIWPPVFCKLFHEPDSGRPLQNKLTVPSTKPGVMGANWLNLFHVEIHLDISEIRDFVRKKIDLWKEHSHIMLECTYIRTQLISQIIWVTSLSDSIFGFFVFSNIVKSLNRRHHRIILQLI